MYIFTYIYIYTNACIYVSEPGGARGGEVDGGVLSSNEAHHLFVDTTYIYIFIYICIYVYVYMYIYICDIYTHAYIYTICISEPGGARGQ